MVIMVECALITPPVGLNLYVIQSVAKTQLGEVAKGVFPFLIMMIFTVFIMYIWTDLALYTFLLNSKIMSVEMKQKKLN